MALQAASVVSSAFSVPKEVFAFISYFVLRKVSSLLLTPKKLMGLVFLDIFFFFSGKVQCIFQGIKPVWSVILRQSQG